MAFDPVSMIFWLLILFALLWPQLQHKMLLGQRLATIRKIEKKRNSRVITLIHRQEKIGMFGIPFFRFIDIEDSEEVLRAIRTTPDDTPIDIILHTPGGLVLASYQIALALKEHPAKTTVIVPHYAMSGGTLIALAADEIIMDKHAVLGPVDPQLPKGDNNAVPAASLVTAVETKGEKQVDDETLILADVARKAIKQVEEMVYYLTKDRMGEDKARELAKNLSSGKWTHDYPITIDKARKLGLSVTESVPGEVYELMGMYPQMQQLRPGVEFIPHPGHTNNNGKA